MQYVFPAFCQTQVDLMRINARKYNCGCVFDKLSDCALQEILEQADARDIDELDYYDIAAHYAEYTEAEIEHEYECELSVLSWLYEVAITALDNGNYLIKDL